MRRSLTPLHFIIPRLASVLGSDSEFFYGFTDNISGKCNPGKNRGVFLIKYKSLIFVLIRQVVKVVGFVSLTCSGSSDVGRWRCSRGH